MRNLDYYLNRALVWLVALSIKGVLLGRIVTRALKEKFSRERR